jgi:hypothetical protein
LGSWATLYTIAAAAVRLLIRVLKHTLLLLLL